MGFSWFAILIFWSALFWVIKHYWSRRHLYILDRKIPGQPSLPIIGNALAFLGNPEEMLNTLRKLILKYPSPTKIWFGPSLSLCFSKADQVEKILTSSKLINKHSTYEIIKIYLGNGLISSSGPQWKHDRKIIQPLFTLKFVANSMHVHQKYIDKCMKTLRAKEGAGTFDVQKYVHCYFVDIFGETLLGMEMRAQEGKCKDFVKDTVDMYSVGYERMMKPWLHPDICYYFSPMKTQQDKIIKNITSFISDATSNAKSRYRHQKADHEWVPSIMDQLTEIRERNPNTIGDTDFIHHMFTLYAASEDTTTLVSSALCVCFGMYPECQQKAAEEVRVVFGETPRKIYYEDVCKLEYIDRCVKEVLRLVPIAPFIGRQVSEEVTIDDVTIPTDVGIIIFLFGLHYDPDYWENPTDFHPDHFLPDNVKKRHPYAYVPFSGGPRSCIGKTLAHLSIKYLIGHILQEFEIEADGKFPDIKLRADISTRFVDGCNIRLKKRVWM